jgi:hypothetical protein
MAKRTRDADVPPLMRAIASRDRSGGGGEVGGDEPLEAKEKLLQEGDADAAWQLHLEEEERKFWQTVQAEVRCRPPPARTSPLHTSSFSLGASDATRLC